MRLMLYSLVLLRKNLASGAIDEIVVTDTIPLSEEIKALGRVRVLTLSAMLAEVYPSY